MSKTVIKIENLSKIYRLGEVGTGTLSHDLNRWFRMNLLGQDDPYAKIGHVNDRTQKAEKGELVAALRDINLEVKEGEVLGIIGKNGAGKSTLLKLLSRVTSPTTGSIKVKGRLASLLEVGTGFHPEMTGRENIYMNGTIMGMRKWEIDRKLDEIVNFAGVTKYLDTPTKRYSSGMTVRLGFAIAAHLEPEILVVDEVLAVGDAEFQKKAIGKMQDVSQNHGRTVLFVSHNMGAVKRLCPKSIILKNGTILNIGNSEEVINQYIEDNAISENNIKIESIAHGVRLEKININNNYPIISGQEASFSFTINFSNLINNPSFIVGINNLNEENLLYLSTEPISGYKTNNCIGNVTINLKIPEINISGGKYSLIFGIAIPKIEFIIQPTKVADINIKGDDVYHSGHIIDNTKSFLITKHKWEIFN